MSRILVVEDNANLAYGLATSLELEGHEVVLAEDGARVAAGTDLLRVSGRARALLTAERSALMLLVCQRSLRSKHVLAFGQHVVDLPVEHVGNSQQSLEEAEVIAARMTPVGEVFDRFPRLMRDLARGCRNHDPDLLPFASTRSTSSVGKSPCSARERVPPTTNETPSGASTACASSMRRALPMPWCPSCVGILPSSRC